MAALLLFSYKTLLVWNFLSQVKINLIVNAGLLSETSELTRGNCNVSFNDTDLLNDLHLLVFSSVVFLLEAIKLSYEPFNFRSVLVNLRQALCLDLLLLNLDLLVLLLEVTELFLESSEVPLSVSQFINVRLKLRNEKLVVLINFGFIGRDSFSDRSTLSEWHLWRYSQSWLVLVLSCGGILDWRSGSVSARFRAQVFPLNNMNSFHSIWVHLPFIHAVSHGRVINWSVLSWVSLQELKWVEKDCVTYSQRWSRRCHFS